jgi:hypothetical protein
MHAYKPHDTVRSLVTMQIPGWNTVCTPGYLFSVEQVNDDGTLFVSRSGDGNVTVKARDIEPAYRVRNGISYSSRTSDAVVDVLENVRHSGKRIRVNLGDRETGRDWLEEFDVEGRIGTSMGPTKIPLIIHHRQCHGGPGLLDDAVIKIRTTGKSGRTLYRHPKYHVGKMEMVPGRDAGYAAAITIDGQLHAQFVTPEKAVRWVKKMFAK